VLAPLAAASVDIATLAALIATDEEHTNPNVVKVVGSPVSATRLRASPQSAAHTRPARRRPAHALAC
jgi:CMP-2-keto-3-deoxyoctulosonic acid synthetase